MAKIQGFGSFSSIFIGVFFHGISLHFIVKTLNFHISKFAKFAIRVFCLEIRFVSKISVISVSKKVKKIWVNLQSQKKVVRTIFADFFDVLRFEREMKR